MHTTSVTAILLTLALLLTQGCSNGPQELDSPCVEFPEVADDEQSCPACSSDDDCIISSNPCYSHADCVPRAGNWAVTLLGCDEALEYEVPPDSDCVCINSVCQAKP